MPAHTKPIKWTLTEADAADLTALLDMAVKAGGIKVSGRAAQLHASLVEAFEASKAEPQSTGRATGDTVVPIAESQ